MKRGRENPDYDSCDIGHREIWYDRQANCPICELERYIKIVAKRLDDTKAMMDHLVTLVEKRNML